MFVCVFVCVVSTVVEVGRETGRGDQNENQFFLFSFISILGCGFGFEEMLSEGGSNDWDSKHKFSPFASALAW